MVRTGFSDQRRVLGHRIVDQRCVVPYHRLVAARLRVPPVACKRRREAVEAAETITGIDAAVERGSPDRREIAGELVGPDPLGLDDSRVAERGLASRLAAVDEDD